MKKLDNLCWLKNSQFIQQALTIPLLTKESKMKKNILFLTIAAALLPIHASAKSDAVADQMVVDQRAALAASTTDKGFGPQSPRDIDSMVGTNDRAFNEAPSYREMNLCNIHFHKNAEHKGGEFTTYAGNGDGKGFQSGYQYNGPLTKNESAPMEAEVCPSDNGGLNAGDTIEVHYVHSSAKINPGPTLGACLSESIMNPQLRVETQVYVLVNDGSALDFTKVAAHGMRNGLHQALNMPTDTGVPVQYAGSTTGPGYNEKGSPLQVSWSVRPRVAKVNVASVGEWCKSNAFDEDQAHGVRNLVQNPDLLSQIKY